MNEEYIPVMARVRARSPKAVLLDNGTVEAWVPRSCLHGADDLYLNKHSLDDMEEREFRIMEWQAKVKGFI